ncbi:MAG: hypothetical protein SFX73_34695 [Kofleriaceae bacterium]|nr:hypothetical protein [Kofleriaceae bacterium]
MTDWLAPLLANHERPILERLRFLEGLETRDDLTAEEVVDVLGDEDDDDLASPAYEPDVARGLTRLLRSDRWLPLVRLAENNSVTYHLSVMLVAELDTRLVPAAVAALGGPDADLALRVLGEVCRAPRFRTLLAPAWPEIERLAAHPSFDIASPSIKLALGAGRLSSTVIAGIERALVAALDGGISSYGAQLDLEGLMLDIARAGTSLRSITRSLQPFLQHDAMAWRAAALLAAIGIDAVEVREQIEHLPERGDDPGGVIENALAQYASWSLGGDSAHLTRALALAAPQVIAQFRIGLALEVTPIEDRFLDAMSAVGCDPAWTAIVCQACARIGQRASSIVRALPELVPAHDAYVWDCEARWRCGVRSADNTRRALEQAFDGPFGPQAWGLYGEIAATDPIALARLRDELAKPTRSRENLVQGTPETWKHLLPDLVRGGYDSTVLLAWRELPTEVFWGALGEDHPGHG